MTCPKRAIASQQRGPRLRGTPDGEPVRVWLLGGFRVTVGPRSIGEEAWRLKKAASLLKLLALAPGHRLHRVAMDVYGGELLPEDRYEPWVEGRRAELGGAYLSLLVELAGVYEERKEFEPAIEALQRAVAEERTHEGAHVGLMRLYALSGRRREALRQYEWLREALFKEFGTEPEAAATRLQEEIWAGTFPPADSPPASIPAAEEEAPPAGAARHELPRHNLPLARTSFVGREREKLEAKRLLAMTGLLTLTGAGGSGKTRLALEVARDLVSAY